MDKPIVATVKKARIEYVFRGILWTSGRQKTLLITKTAYTKLQQVIITRLR